MSKQFGDLSYANFSPQYVGQDIEGIKAIAQQKHDLYDANVASADKMDILRNELYQKVDPKDANYIKSAIDKANADLESIRQSGRWEDAQYKINKTAKDLAMNNNVIGAVQWKQQKDATIKDIQDRIGLPEDKNGISQETADNAIRMINSNPDNKKPVVWNPETLSFDNKFKGFSPVKNVDIGKLSNDFLKDWKADTRVIDGKSVNGYFNNTTHEFANQEQMNKAAQQYINSNADAVAYMNQEDLFHKQNFKNPDGSFRQVNNNDLARVGLTENKFNSVTGNSLDNLTPKEKEKAYFDLLRQQTLTGYTNPSADKYSYDKLSEHNVKDWISEVYMKDRLRKAASKAEDDSNQSIETFGNDKVDNNNNINNGLKGTPLEGAKYSTDGELVAEKKAEFETVKGYSPLSVKGQNTNYTVQKPTGKTGFDDEINQKRVNFITDLQRKNPSLQKLKPQQVAEAYALANKSNSQISNDSHSLGGLDNTKITKNVINDLGGRQILVDDDNSGDTTLKGAIDKLGLSEEEIKTNLLNAKSTSILPISNNKAGSFKFQVQGGDGLPHTITISGSNEQQSYYDVAAKMAEAEKKGETGSRTFIAQDPNKINANKGKINDNTLSEYHAVTQIVPNENGGYMYSTRGGKIYSKKETNDYLKAKNASKEELEQNGAIFTEDGRLVQNLSGKEIMKNSTKEWLCSDYNIKNRIKEVKNPIDFNETESNTEE